MTDETTTEEIVVTDVPATTEEVVAPTTEEIAAPITEDATTATEEVTAE